MTHFPGSPPTLKGALVSVDLAKLAPTVVVFQYNPHTLTRSLEAKSGDGGGASGAPVETISLEVELDATDALERGDASAELLGLHPQLAALEQLLYPATAQVVANQVMTGLGVIEIFPPMPAITLFIWGAARVLPVSIASFSVTEEAHDTRLNPIRARVSLSMRVLSYNDLNLAHPGNALFLAHQTAKEVMAKAALGSLDSALGANARLF
jgi:hypothetical protein